MINTSQDRVSKRLHRSRCTPAAPRFPARRFCTRGRPAAFALFHYDRVMSSWPELPLAPWRDTYATLLLYSQIVGKIRLALVPKMNQWWNVPLYLTTRGLTTSPMPYHDRTIAIDFDFIDHDVVVTDSDGHVRRLALSPRPVCDFYDALFAELAAIDVHVQISAVPQEC